MATAKDPATAKPESADIYDLQSHNPVDRGRDLSAEEVAAMKAAPEPGVSILDVAGDTPPDPAWLAGALTLEQIKQAVRARHDTAIRELADARQQRDHADAVVRRAVLEEKEAARILNSLEPKKRK